MRRFDVFGELLMLVVLFPMIVVGAAYVIFTAIKMTTGDESSDRPRREGFLTRLCWWVVTIRCRIGCPNADQNGEPAECPECVSCLAAIADTQAP